MRKLRRREGFFLPKARQKVAEKGLSTHIPWGTTFSRERL